MKKHLHILLLTLSLTALISCNSELSQINKQKESLAFRMDSIDKISVNETNLWQIRNGLNQLEKDVIDLGYIAHTKDYTYDNKEILAGIEKRVARLNILEEHISIMSQIDNLKKPQGYDPKHTKSYSYQLHQIKNSLVSNIETCNKLGIDPSEFKKLKSSIDIQIAEVDIQLDELNQMQENNLRKTGGYVTLFTDATSVHNYVSNRIFYSRDRTVIVRISNTININYSDAYFNLSYAAISGTTGIITGESLNSGGTIKIYVDSRTGCLNSSGDYYCAD